MNSRIISFLFGLFICSAFFMNIFAPPDTESVQRENREMTPLPSLNQNTVFSGTFAKNFESYLNDKVGFRGILTDWAADFKNMQGIKSDLGRVLSIDKDMGTGVTEKTSLILYNHSIAEIFKENPEARDLYIDTMNQYAQKIDPDIHLYSMIVPTQLEFMPPMYANIQSSQKESIDYIDAHFDERIQPVNVYDTLKAHSDEYLYFRTDHHWTALGAYYAYQAFCEAAGDEPVDISDFEKHTIPDFLGSLYDQSRAEELLEQPDSIDWYDVDPDEEITVDMRGLDEDGVLVDYTGSLYDKNLEETKYQFFLCGDNPLVRVKNPNASTDKTLLMIKDSYANAFVPWACQTYREIIIIDPRSFWTTVEEVLDANHVDDFLVLNYVFTTAFPDYCELLNDICD